MWKRGEIWVAWGMESKLEGGGKEHSKADGWRARCMELLMEELSIVGTWMIGVGTTGKMGCDRE